MQGAYIIQLIVNDGNLNSAPDTVTITAQQQMVTVPDVVGMEQSLAETIIISANLIVGTITTAYSSTVPAGNVISQNPVGGASVPEGSPVDLVISLGPDLTPTITGFSPNTGNAGTTVIITGTNFIADTPANTQAAFNNIPSTIINITDTSITTTVPPGAATGPVSITTPYGTAVSANTFTVNTNIPQPVPPTAYLKGSVFDAATDAPVSGVEISVNQLTGVIQSDNNGEFTYAVPNGGEYVIYFQKQGYVTAKAVVYIESTRTTLIDPVRLTPYDSRQTLIIAADGGTATDSTGTVEMIFPPGALPADTTVSATRFFSPKGYVVPIPKGQVFIDAVQLEPAHTAFNGVVTVRLTNRFGFAPGTKLPFAFGSHEPDDPFPELSYYGEPLKTHFQK